MVKPKRLSDEYLFVFDVSCDRNDSLRMYGLRTNHYWKCLPIVLPCMWRNLASGESIERPNLTGNLCWVGAGVRPVYGYLSKAVEVLGGQYRNQTTDLAGPRTSQCHCRGDILKPVRALAGGTRGIESWRFGRRGLRVEHARSGDTQ